MGATWKHGPKKRRHTHSVLTLGVAVFVLLASTATLLGVQRATSTNRLKTNTSGDAERADRDNPVSFTGITRAATRDSGTTGKPDNKPAAEPKRLPLQPSVAPPSAPPPTPAPATPPPPPTLPPDQPFEIYGPSELTLSLSVGSITASFTTNDNSDVNWSGSGPEQNEIGASFENSNGPGYSVTFTALESAVPETEVAFSVRITDAERGIDITKTIEVTITE